MSRNQIIRCSDFVVFFLFTANWIIHIFYQNISLPFFTVKIFNYFLHISTIYTSDIIFWSFSYTIYRFCVILQILLLAFVNCLLCFFTSGFLPQAIKKLRQFFFEKLPQLSFSVMNHNSDENMGQSPEILHFSTSIWKHHSYANAHLRNNIKAGLVTRTI